MLRQLSIGAGIISLSASSKPTSFYDAKVERMYELAHLAIFCKIALKFVQEYE